MAKKVSKYVDSIIFIRSYSPQLDVAIVCANSLPYPYPDISNINFVEEFLSVIEVEFKRGGLSMPILTIRMDKSSDPAPFTLVRCPDKETAVYLTTILPIRLPSFGTAELLILPDDAALSRRIVKYQVPFFTSSGYAMMLELLTESYGYLGNILYHKLENPPEMGPKIPVYHTTKPGPFVYLYILVPPARTFAQKLLYYVGLY